VSYVQFLRLRKALFIYFPIIGGLFLCGVLLPHVPGTTLDFGDGPGHGKTPSIPLSFVFFIAAWCAIIFATVVSTSLNKEYDGVEMVWTKPISRERLALRYIALDLVAIVVAFASVAALYLLAVLLLGLGKYLAVDARTVPTLVIGLGTAVMWYGLVQGLTAWLRGRGAIVIGISWAVAFVLLSFAEATRYAAPEVHAFFMGLDVLNPLAYYSSYSLSGYGAHASPVLPQFLAGTEMRSLMTWTIGALGCISAVVGWKRLEA